ncbi:MAG: aminotransferase class III-fold pyridoxal phosphate-dependent enzyme, partial [Balneolaceae bacterium]
MSTNTQYDAVLARLKELMSEALPHAAGEEDLEIPFLEMGANSLMLMDVQKTIESEYGLTITIGQFFEELTNIKALVHYIDGELQAQGLNDGNGISRSNANGEGESAGMNSRSVEGDSQPPVNLPAWSGEASGSVSGSQNIQSGDLEAIFANQIRMTSEAMNDLVARQLAFLQGTTPQAGQNTAPSIPSGVPGTQAGSGTPLQGTQSEAGRPQQTATKPSSSRPKGATQPNKMLSPLEIRARGLSPEQQRHLETLIKAYNARTGKSKAYAQRYRGVLADSRAAIGFRFSTKEMLYPLVADRASGSRVWDLDGNEYIDITMGQGVSLFGHHPDVIENALTNEGNESVQLGPRPHNTGELAELICEMTGFERVAFTNTGTEAVMAALRLARAATGRTKIVMFEGAY